MNKFSSLHHLEKMEEILINIAEKLLGYLTSLIIILSSTTFRKNNKMKIICISIKLLLLTFVLYLYINNEIISFVENFFTPEAELVLLMLAHHIFAKFLRLQF